MRPRGVLWKRQYDVAVPNFGEDGAIVVAMIFEDETPFAGIEITILRRTECYLQRIVDLPR